MKAGDVIKVKYPFYFSEYDKFDIMGEHECIETWVPGCREVPCPPDDWGMVADSMGFMVLTIVDIHKPGRYPERVFYTRKWIDPDGKEFGASKLHIATTPTFKRRAKGYYYKYTEELLESTV